MERVTQALKVQQTLLCAVDVGCGTGLSTAPLRKIAACAVGIEPDEQMLRYAPAAAPGARFVAGCAEALPISSSAVDLITAAGSLNYADLNRFFPEAVRVLRPGGVLVIYDFSQGKTMRDSSELEAWHADFIRRYPRPADDSQILNPEILAALDSGLEFSGHEWFEIGLALTPRCYADYAMTETNVAAAIRSGTEQQEIRSWCANTLEPVFGGAAREVLFKGYIVYLRQC